MVIQEGNMLKKGDHWYEKERIAANTDPWQTPALKGWIDVLVSSQYILSVMNK